MPRELPKKVLVAFSFAGEHRDLLRRVAELVEEQLGQGTVFFDEWFQFYLAGSDADLQLQQIFGERCELAVVCVSESGDSPWVRAEYEAIRARYKQARISSNDLDKLRILPIRVGDGDIKGLEFNTIVPDVRRSRADEVAALIVERLGLISSRPESIHESSIWGWPQFPPSIQWAIANQLIVLEAFRKLLTRDTESRILLISGPSETGKSHIARQMLANVLRMAGITCGRLDFKGTTDIDAAVSEFAHSLDVDLPSANLPPKERLSYIVKQLSQRAQPTLLVFDTYELAGETQAWMEDRLLVSAIRESWLRIVIAGQSIPRPHGTVWDSLAMSISLQPPLPTDWLSFGKHYHPELTLEMVQTMCKLANDRGSLLAQIFGPAS